VGKKDLLVLFTDVSAMRETRVIERLGEERVLELIKENLGQRHEGDVDRVFKMIEVHTRASALRR